MIPQVPTDNLYKFIAISGLITIGSSILFYERYDSQLFERETEITSSLEVLSIKYQDAADTLEILTEYSRKRTEIFKNSLEAESAVEGGLSRSQLLSYLEEIDEDKQEVLSTRKELLNLRIAKAEQKEAERKLELLRKRTCQVKAIGFAAFFSGIIISLLGFFLWFKKSQRFIDKSVRQQVENSSKSLGTVENVSQE